MNIEDEYTYDTTIEDIVFHLEQLIADVILTSIKRLSAEQKETVSIGMQKCTKNRNEKCTTSLKPIMVNSSVKGGMRHDFMGEIYGHYDIASARV